MELTTEPAFDHDGSMTVRGIIVDDHGELVPSIFSLKFSIEASNDSKAMNTAINIISGYNNRVWVINGYSLKSRAELIENALYFNVNAMGGIGDTLAQELKLRIYNECASQDVALTQTFFSAKLYPLKDAIVFSVNGETHMASLFYVESSDRKESCDTCKQGADLIRIAFDQLSGKNFAVCDKESDTIVTITDTKIPITLFDTVIESDSELAYNEVLTEWFTVTNQGAMEMARYEKAGFLFVGV